ncbi:MAG: hypothetical protein WB780_19655 [Candidatus Acidiferrales bacterium]
MAFDYSLAAMLPFARAAIRNTSNFSPEQFATLMFGELEKVSAPGVSRNAPTGVGKYNFSDLQVPHDLKHAIVEVFWHLEHRGFILPEPQTFPQSFNRGMYWKTARGTAWANGAAPLPEDVAGYMRHLSSLVPSIDSVICQYVEEGLGSFARGSFFSAAVMIGAASEKEIYLLAGSMVDALKDPSAQARLTKQITTGRSLYALLEMIRKYIEGCARLRGEFDGALTHLSSLFEAIRVQRNDAVHPTTGAVDEDSVQLSYEAFPYAIQKTEILRAWFGEHPASV